MSDNITTMGLKKVQSILDTAIKLNKKGMHIPVLLHGEKGIGKSTIVAQFAKRNNHDLSVVNLANMNPEDMLGAWDFDKKEYTKPSFLIESEKPVVYFLDELTRAPKYMLQTVFNLFTEKRLHQWKLKESDIVISATNPDNGAYEVTSFEDDAFISRFAHVKMSPEKSEFTDYIGSKYKNTIVQQVLKKSVNIYQDSTFDLGFNVVPDNRKLEKVAFIFEHLDDNEIENGGMEMLECLVGFETSSSFLESWRDSKKNQFDPKTILKSETKDYGFDDNAIEVMNNVNVKMVAFMKSKKTLTKPQQEGFKRYFDFLPKDVKVDFAKQTVKVHENFIEYVDSDEVFELLNLGE